MPVPDFLFQSPALEQPGRSPLRAKRHHPDEGGSEQNQHCAHIQGVLADAGVGTSDELSWLFGVLGTASEQHDHRRLEQAENFSRSYDSRKSEPTVVCPVSLQ